MEVILRRPTLLDVMQIARNAREADKKEAFLFSGKTLLENLNNTPGLYSNSQVWEVDGKVVCLFGVTPFEDGNNVLWFLATDEFDNHRKTISKVGKKIFDEVVKDYDYLFNYVHADHTKALRWIKWLGCEVREPEPLGINGEMFCKFEVRNV